MTSPGRSCPVGYGYAPRVFAREPEVVADTLYVIGGLYGNGFALDAIDRMATREGRSPTRIFNGDFHWVDADAQLFTSVQRRVLAHVALRGNVETELASEQGSAGCGCAYPERVPDDEVERSNRILARLRAVVADLPGVGHQLPGLAAHAVAQVGRLRIGVVHGDAWSLAGWRFAPDRLHSATGEADLLAAFEESQVDGFASTHTCSPALKVLGQRFVINNGAAGMPNFAGDPSGLLTRISVHPVPPGLEDARLFGLRERGVWIDALRIPFDRRRWIAQFDRLWPSGTPARISYRDRIVRGPRFSLEHALGAATGLPVQEPPPSPRPMPFKHHDRQAPSPRKELRWTGNDCC